MLVGPCGSENLRALQKFGHVTTKVYVPWDKIYMPRACGHTLMSSPGMTEMRTIFKSQLNLRRNVKNRSIRHKNGHTFADTKLFFNKSLV